jgi:hypothetical protein
VFGDTLKTQQVKCHAFFLWYGYKKNNIMGILDLFKKKIKDAEMCLLRDLITVALADGSMSDKARKAIAEITQSNNIHICKFQQACSVNPENIADVYPIDEEGKKKYLFQLVYILTIDKYYSKRKVDYVEFIAKKLGYTSQYVHEEIECITTSPFYNTKESKQALIWKLKNERSFTQEEIDAVSQAIVVVSKYGNSVEFTMKSTGKPCYIPLDKSSNIAVGEVVDMKQVKLLTLEKEGESDIVRVKI